jgi:hypothetical protein
MDSGDKLALRQTFSQSPLGCNPGYEAGLGMGQKIIGRTTENDQWVTDDFQFGVGTQTRKLNRPVSGGVGTKGFVVVPVERVRQLL